MHVGDGAWILVDSCGSSDAPAALDYLRAIGVDPSQAVAMIVATHWHDDHIRGLARMVQVCEKASFCCASVLCDEEFLTIIRALEGRHYASCGSGVSEIHGVISVLAKISSTPTFAIANRDIFAKGICRIRALSPDDQTFLRFMRALGRLIPEAGQAETRIPSLSPNAASVVLRVEVSDVAVLLGSDLEKGGWLKILQDKSRPPDTASVFKVPHHGAEAPTNPAYGNNYWILILSRCLLRGGGVAIRCRATAMCSESLPGLHAHMPRRGPMQASRLAGHMRSTERSGNRVSGCDGRRSRAPFEFGDGLDQVRVGRSRCLARHTISTSTSDRALN